jgi:hypothetical protein
MVGVFLSFTESSDGDSLGVTRSILVLERYPHKTPTAPPETEDDIPAWGRAVGCSRGSRIAVGLQSGAASDERAHHRRPPQESPPFREESVKAHQLL